MVDGAIGGAGDIWLSGTGGIDEGIVTVYPGGEGTSFGTTDGGWVHTSRYTALCQPLATLLCPAMNGSHEATNGATGTGEGFLQRHALAELQGQAGQLAQVDSSRLNVTFAQGVGLQFLNIKAWMLALALAAGWVTSAGSQPAANPGERLAIVCAVMVGFALTSNFAYALAGSLLRGWLAQGRRLVVFNRVMAAVLVATAIWLVGA